MRKVTIELIVSAIIVSFLESFALVVTGLLKPGGYAGFIAVTIVLAVIELGLMFVLEEFLMKAKHHVKKRFKG